MLIRNITDRRYNYRYLLLILVLIPAIYFLAPTAFRFPFKYSSSTIPDTPQTQLEPPHDVDVPVTSSKGSPSQIPEDMHGQPSPSLTRPEFHVVVAHYEEEPYFIRTWLDDLREIPYIQELGLYITIYTKGPNSDTENIKKATGADSVIKLPNIGREGGSYLTYILENYGDPPLFTLFAQSYLKMAQKTEKGPTEGHLADWLNTRLKDRFSKQTGFMSLDRKHDICYCGHCEDMKREDFYPLWSQLYALITGQVCQQHEGHIVSFNGHFIVSRRRMLDRPRHIYEYLAELVNAPEEHWIHTEPEPTWFDKDKGKSKPSNPKFGHTLERLWHSLFDCDGPEKVKDCEIVGMKAEGPGGCSCND